MSDYETDEAEDYELDQQHQEFLDIQQAMQQRDEMETDLRWDLQEIWGKSLPDGFTLQAWERSNVRMEDCFHSSTMLRETGKRGYGTLRVNSHDWCMLKRSAKRYAEVYNVPSEPIFCCMAAWYLKP